MPLHVNWSRRQYNPVSLLSSQSILRTISLADVEQVAAWSYSDVSCSLFINQGIIPMYNGGP